MRRFVACILLPAQLPGNVHDAIYALTHQPLRTLWRALRRNIPCAMLASIIAEKKFELPVSPTQGGGGGDPQLRRLDNNRELAIKNGWIPLSVKTRDNYNLSAIRRPPPSPQKENAHVIFVCGNMQKYEDHFPYFERYAIDTGLGFVAFHYRGVGRSEGAPSSAEHLVEDVQSVVHALMAEVNLPASRLLIHGFSIGGAVAATYLSTVGAVDAALVLDRTFRSLPHAAGAIVRGELMDVEQREGYVPKGSGACISHGAGTILTKIGDALRQFWHDTKAAVVHRGLRCLHWELNALDAASRLPSRAIVIYHKQDDMIHYASASLHAALVGIPGDSSCVGHDGPREWVSVQVHALYGGGYGTHDLPLCLDEHAWQSYLQCVEWALDQRRN